MRGARAKAIRRAVYGDMSSKPQRLGRGYSLRREKPSAPPICILAPPIRRAYQAAKAAFKASHGR